VSRANSVFEQQLGLRLQVSTLVLNEGEGGDYRSTGPNFAPATPGERSCTGYQAQGVTGHGANVTVSGIDVALGMLARWASTNHPDDDLWHLLTDCFPSPGTVGIASKGGLCKAPGQRTSFVATTIDPDPSDNLTLVQRLDACDRQGYEGVVEGTRLCARALYSGAACGADSHPGGGNTTPGKLELCSANAGVSSNGPSLWHTFAHEIAHGLGGGHTFGDGGLLDYTGERALYDAADICAYLEAGGQGCLEEVAEAVTAATCGNGAHESPEACDDGGLAPGDGCDASCAVEPSLQP